MMGHVREIHWTEDGWPVVPPERYAAVPEAEISEESIVGRWEYIILEYQYQTIQRFSIFNFNADHTLSGSMAGSWSYDESTNTLAVNNNKMIVENAWDWESAPRTTTLTYTGLTSGGRSLWGEKIE